MDLLPRRCCLYTGESVDDYRWRVIRKLGQCTPFLVKTRTIDSYANRNYPSKALLNYQIASTYQQK